MAELIAEAVEIADELDQIRCIYGSECVSYIKRALVMDHTNSGWRQIIDRAMDRWMENHSVGLGGLLV